MRRPTRSRPPDRGHHGEHDYAACMLRHWPLRSQTEVEGCDHNPSQGQRDAADDAQRRTLAPITTASSTVIAE